MKLSIIIISFNTKDTTKKCLDSLAALSDMRWGDSFEVIVVDNGSADGSIEMLKEYIPPLTLIETGENLGFSKANNLGVKSSSGEFILFLNSDTTVPNGTLSEMLRLMETDSSIGVATCKVDLASGGLDWDCHRGIPTPWASFTRLLGLGKLFPKSRWLNEYYQGYKDMKTTHEIDSGVGAFILTKREIGEMIGWWDEDYFLNGEDIDFCFQVKKLGYKVMYHPEVSIVHYRGVSKGTRTESKDISNVSKDGKKLVTNSGMDAMKIFYDKNLRQSYSTMVNALVDLGIYLLRIVRLIKVRFRG